MKISGRKMMTYWVSNAITLTIYFSLLFFKDESLTPTMVISFLMLFFAFNITLVGGNTLDKWIKSKWFNDKLL
jgi:hypothetical protein